MNLWLGIFLLPLGGPALAGLHVEVSSPAPGPSSMCTFRGDEMRLSVSDGDRLIAVHRFCSAYGKATARIVTDAKGQPYLLLRHSVGHGSHASEDFITVYRIGKQLVERGSVIAREPVGIYADANYEYAIRTPRSGGLELVGLLKVTGQGSTLDIAPDPATRLKIDVP